MVASALSAESVVTGELTLETISERWDALMAKVQVSQKTLGIFLRLAQLVSFDGKVLKIAYSSEDRFPMSQVVDNRAALEKACEELWGQSFRLQCEETQVATAQDEPKKVVNSSDPIVKSVLDTFDGEVV